MSRSGGPPAGALSHAVAAALGTEVVGLDTVGGGSVSTTARATLADGRQVFAKSSAGLAADQLAVEADGLAWLGAVDGVPVPTVLACTADVLVLDWIAPGARHERTDELLGRALAHLHAAEVPSFGWHRDGYIGTEPQQNTPTAADWPTFWIERRIGPLVERAVRRGAIGPGGVGLVERLRDRLPDLAGPPEPAVRVHGDLWSGNVHVGAGGRPWLVDPAAYGGHREVDLAMLHLFGAPGPAFAAAYEEVRPLEGGWRERLDLWQLEPLLNHAVMFGGGYGASARAVLRRWA